MAELKPDDVLHTITSDLVITTNADDLVELVKAKKEIPMSDAAKQLKVSLATIEAWAGFLEEEGILTIKYKLTTPYLVEKTAEAQFEAKAEAEQPKKLDKIFLKHSKKTRPKIKSELKPIEVSLELTKGLNALLEKAYDHIEKGDFENAQKIYSLIKQNYDSLPTNFREMKRELETNLTKLDKDLAINLHKASAKQAKLLSKLIGSELRRMKISMMRKDIKKAETIFKEVEELYSRFPDGFVLKKTSLQNQILEAYKGLVKHKHILIARYINTRTKEIETLMKEVKTNLSEGNIDNALDNYARLREVYNKIPRGFLQDNPELEKEILQLLLTLISTKQERSARKMSENTQKIKSIMISIQALLSRNQVEEANKQYNQLKELYDELPTGFLKTKVELEEQILGLHQVITKRLNNEYIKGLSHGTKKINTLLLKAKAHLKKGEPEIAESIHREIEHHYNQLPKGFLQHKTILRVQVLDLYREILLKSDEPILKDFDEAADKKYKQLVYLIVRSHQLIEDSKFELLQPEYEKIKALYGHLPFSLVKQKTRLRQEVTKLQSLLDMYKKATQLDENKNNPAELNLLIKQTNKLYSTLINNCPGDEILFEFVRKKLEHYKASPTPQRSQPTTPTTATPRLVKTLLTQAESHLNQNNLFDAQNLFKRVLRLDSNNPIAKSRLAMIEQKRKPTGVESIYQKSISRVRSQQHTPPKTAQQHPGLIAPTPAIKKPTRTEPQLQPKPKIQPKPKPIRKIHSKSLEEHYKDAIRCYEQKDYYNATKIFREIKKQNPNFKDVQKLLQQTIREQNKRELRQMLNDIKQEHKKLEQTPTKKPIEKSEPVTIERPVERKAERLNILTDIKLKKAKEFVRQDRTEEAISTLDSILKINPDSTKAKHMLMEIKPAKKDYKKPRLNTPIKA